MRHDGTYSQFSQSLLCRWLFEGVQRLREERPRTVANFDHASTGGFLCLKSFRLPDSWDYICSSDQASENHLGTNARPVDVNLGPFSHPPPPPPPHPAPPFCASSLHQETAVCTHGRAKTHVENGLYLGACIPWNSTAVRPIRSLWSTAQSRRRKSLSIIFNFFLRSRSPLTLLCPEIEAFPAGNLCRKWRV